MGMYLQRNTTCSFGYLIACRVINLVCQIFVFKRPGSELSADQLDFCGARFVQFLSSAVINKVKKIAQWVT